MRQAAAGRGRTTKHTSATKHTHGQSAKHHPTKKAAAATHHQKFTKILVVTVGPHGKVSVRTAPLGDALPICAAESVAASARLAGWPVAGADTLELFRRTDGPATIPATLEAAARYGLAGVKPRGWVHWSAFETDYPAALSAPGAPRQQSSLLLGLALPGGPHAVTVAGDGCWLSWGGHYEPFPDAVAEEAWEVAWPRC